MSPPETTGIARAIAELGAERDRVAVRLAQIDQTITLLRELAGRTPEGPGGPQARATTTGTRSPAGRRWKRNCGSSTWRLPGRESNSIFPEPGSGRSMAGGWPMRLPASSGCSLPVACREIPALASRNAKLVEIPLFDSDN